MRLLSNLWRRPNEFGHFLSFNLAYIHLEVKREIGYKKFKLLAPPIKNAGKKIVNRQSDFFYFLNKSSPVIKSYLSEEKSNPLEQTKPILLQVISFISFI